MRRVPSLRLWLGHVFDAREVTQVMNAGIIAVVDLAANEPPVNFPRDIVYCRIPLVDGGGNAAWLLNAAIETVAGFLRNDVAALVYCSAGISRTPAISAAAIARVRGCSLSDALLLVANDQPADVSPALWQDITALRSVS